MTTLYDRLSRPVPPRGVVAVIVITIIIFFVFMLPLLSAIVSQKSTINVPTNCADASMISVLSDYGHVSVGYSSSYFRSSKAKWYASLRVDHSGSVRDLRLEHEGETMCDALSKLYDDAAQFPLQRKTD